MVEPDHGQLSIERQCELLGLARSSVYYQPVGETSYNLQLMRVIDEVYTAHPMLGVRRICFGARVTLRVTSGSIG